VDERLRFIARLLDGDKMADVCDDFGISRKTGYKIYERYQHTGVHGLTDRMLFEVLSLMYQSPITIRIFS
jgi:transposase